MILRIIGWLLLLAIGFAIVIILFPLLLLIAIVAIIIGAFRRTLFLSWVSRVRSGAQQGAQAVRQKMTEPSKDSHKPGERKRAVVEARSRDL